MFVGDLISLRVGANSESASRFSVSVSKKVAKKANTRNRLRRVVYEMVREHIQEIKDKALIQFVFRKTPKNKKEIESAFGELLNKIKK